MKEFKRNDLLFSLCGLNCGLCPMHLDNHCPDCGGGAAGSMRGWNIVLKLNRKPKKKK